VGLMSDCWMVLQVLLVLLLVLVPARWLSLLQRAQLYHIGHANSLVVLRRPEATRAPVGRHDTWCSSDMQGALGISERILSQSSILCTASSAPQNASAPLALRPEHPLSSQLLLPASTTDPSSSDEKKRCCMVQVKGCQSVQ